MSDATTYYAEVFKTWQVKFLGAKPTAAQLDSIHKLGARPGKQALANAMALRDTGVTGAQIVGACGAQQLNKMRGFIADNLLKRVPAPFSPEGHVVYKCEITAKGLNRIKAAEARLASAAADATGTAKAKPVKAASKPKAKAEANEAAMKAFWAEADAARAAEAQAMADKQATADLSNVELVTPDQPAV